MNHIIKQLTVSVLLSCFLGVTHAQKLETAKTEYEMAAGQTSSFAVNLKDAKANTYNAFTLSMFMPEGISLVGNPQLSDQLENPFCVTRENIVWPTNPELYESLTFYALGDLDQDRIVKIAVASATPLPGTAVYNFLAAGFKAALDVAPDLYLIKLQNIKLEYDPKGKDDADDVSVRVRIWKLGDTNRDNAVNVADATNVIASILTPNAPVQYNVMLADMNDDKETDIFDVMKLKNVILYGKLPNSNAQSMSRATENRFYENLSLAFSNAGVTMGIPNAQRFTSFQFEVELPDDTELTGAELTGTSTNHTIEFAKIDDNHYRVIGLSLDNSPLEGNHGNNLISLEIPNGGRISIRKAMFVTPQGEVTYFNDLDMEDGVTRVAGITTTDQHAVYDLLGRKVQMKGGRLPKGVYIIDNKRVVVK